jgi:trans-aconitate methyltransferase
MRDTDKDWNVLANSAPYWGILTDDKFRGDRLDENASKFFFSSGENFIQEIANRFGLNEQQRRSIGIDYGTGVGRLSFPMSRFCNQIYGLDVAQHMLARGKEHAVERGLKTVEFLTPDEFFQQNLHVDWINSYIVFQHIPPRRGAAILDRLLRLLNSNGIVSLHFTFARTAINIPKVINDYRYYSYDGESLRGIEYASATQSGIISMFDYNLSELFTKFYANDIRIIDTLYTNHKGHIGILFLGRRDPTCNLGFSQNVSFSSNEMGGKYLLDGWSRIETWGAWSAAKQATVRLPLPLRHSKTPKKLKLLMRRLPLTSTDAQKLSVRAGSVQQVIEDVRCEPNRDFWIELEIVNLLSSDIIVTIEVDRTFQPKDLIGNLDARELGIGLIQASWDFE